MIQTAFINVYERGMTKLQTHESIEECMSVNKSPLNKAIVKITFDTETFEVKADVVHKYNYQPQ